MSERPSSTAHLTGAYGKRSLPALPLVQLSKSELMVTEAIENMQVAVDDRERFATSRVAAYQGSRPSFEKDAPVGPCQAVNPLSADSL